MNKYNDQIGNTILLKTNPKRIVSLVPSQTELLYDLGLSNEVVGITKFCIYPNEWFHNKIRVGGTKNVNFKKIDDLHPDLIIANKEENTKEDIEKLQKKFQVWVSDIKTLKEALEMIKNLGAITNRKENAELITEKLFSIFEKLPKLSAPKNILYLIWKNPYMSINSDTFIHEMLKFNGFNNLAANLSKRYPTIQESEMQELNPEIVFLSSEPFPFKGKHIKELQEILPKAKIILVNGEMFSWYGSRLLKAPNYFKKLRQNINLQY